MISDIEEISIKKPTEFYDWVYEENNLTFYKLKYIDEMENYNISISLYPVTGITTLRANPKTKPSDLDKFIYI